VNQPTNITHAISLYAPWVWAILHLGKDVENRSLGFPLRKGWVWLHASKTLSRPKMLEEMACVEYMAGLAGKSSMVDADFSLPRLQAMQGHIIGAVEVTGKVLESTSPWFVGPAALTLGRRLLLPQPIATKGALGIWPVPRPFWTQALGGDL
jgi:hypothetical protein